MGIMGGLVAWEVNANASITHYTWSNISYSLNWNELFTWVGTITITYWTDKITILDRNLWATAAWIGCEDPNNIAWYGWICKEGDRTYWYQFQWWNNYGFKGTGSILSGAEKATWSGVYSNNWYYWTTFIAVRTINPGDYWSDSVANSRNHYDLWGGTYSDYISDIDGDNWKLNPESVTNRRGPCPENFHVPSYWELLKLKKMILDYSYYSVIDIHNKLLMPFAGFRSMNTEEMFLGVSAGFWSSSPNYSNSRYFVISNDNEFGSEIYLGTWSSRAYSWPIRCFYDKYKIYSQYFVVTFFNENEQIWNEEVESWGTIPIDIISWYNLTWLTKEWYAFSWWIISWSDEIFDVENDVVTTWMTLNAVRDINQYTITFDTDWWSEIEPITADYWTWISAPANPTKNGYKFVGWNKEIPTTMPAGNLTIKAIWEKLWSSGWWGGRSSKTSSNSEKSTEWQAWNQQPLSPQQASDSSPNREQTIPPLIGGDGEARGGSTQSYTQEFQDAYDFAKEKWITTMPTIQKAQMDWKLTRIAMAKMLSQYAINVLWQKPANIVTPKFNDVTDKQNSDYDDWVTLAYQLWIMWQNMPNNKFRPDDEVTRAEFATALSRMAYWTSDGEYKWTWKYYIHHMEKLVKEWIITNDNPTMKELRWYVMIMLKRSAK